MSRCVVALGLAVLLLTAGPAWAAEGHRWAAPGGYVGVSGVFVNLSDSNVDLPDCPGCDDVVTSETGFGVTGVVGHRFGTGLRLEGELAYRTNDVDEFRIEGVGTLPVTGDVSSLALLGSVYFDFAAGAAVTPYVGGGVGLASVAVDSPELADDNDTVFAYQVKAGLLFPVGATSALVAGYTYFATSDPTIEASTVEYATHNIEVGIRIGF